MPNYLAYQQLPKLNTEGPNLSNALLNAYNIHSMQQRNELAQKTNERDQQRFDFQRKMGALSTALKASSPEQAKMIYKQLLPDAGDSDVDFSFVGNTDIEVKYPNGLKLKGPKSVITDAAEAFSKDPSWWLDEEKGKQTFQYLTSKGVSIEMPQQKTPKIGDTRTFQRGTKSVTQEWTGKGWRDLGEGPKFKPTVDKTKTPENIKKYIDKLEKELATIEQGNAIAINLDGKPITIGGGNNPEATKRYKKHVLKRIRELKASLPENKNDLSGLSEAELIDLLVK